MIDGDFQSTLKLPRATFEGVAVISGTPVDVEPLRIEVER
jgi:hypothetical protein